MSAREISHELIEFFYSALKPRYILFHFLYITSWIIIGSIMIYPQRNMAYIDALFFAAGASTQSGLNTLDLTALSFWQQIVLYIIPSVTNPIFINSSLVFLRLHWFETRVEDIAQRSRIDHRLRKARSFGVTDDNIDLAEQGVGGRPITVVHSAKMTEQNFPGHKIFGGRPPPDSISRAEADEALLNAQQRNSSDNSSLGSVKRSYQFALAMRNRANAPPNHDGDGSSDQDDQTKQRSSSSSDEPGPVIFGNATSAEISENTTLASSTSQHPTPEVSAVTRDIRFGDLPSPRHPRPHYQEYEDDDAGDEAGPALVIKSPREQELEAEQAERDARRHGRDVAFVLSPVVGHGLRYKRGPDQSGDSLGDNVDQGAISDTEDFETSAPLRPTRSHAIGRDLIIGTPGHKIRERAITIDAPRPGHMINPISDHEGDRGRPFQPRRNISEFFFNRTATMERVERMISRTLSRNKRDSSPGAKSSMSRRSDGALNYLSYAPTIGRNSAFVGLTDEQRAELGGVEYHALKTLSIVLVVYFFGFWILATISLIPWIIQTNRFRAVVEKYDQSPAWWGGFMAMSAFMDLGFSTVPTSMNEMSTAVFPLLLMSFLIVIGNTGFPCMLRLIIWILRWFFPEGSRTKESLQFLLEHPRRCFTLLFPSGPTWWLTAVLVILNGLDLIFFIVLDLRSSELDGWDAGKRILDGLFQAFSTRTAGMTVVDLSTLHPAVQVSYLVMMYISVMPVAISVRRTNVYEEQSLGIYRAHDSDDEDDEEESDSDYSEGAIESESDNEDLVDEKNGRRPGTGPRRRSSMSIRAAHQQAKQRHREKKEQKKKKNSFVTNHLRRQLSFDLWYIFLGLFIICIAEGGKIQDRDRYDFTVFSCFFEIVSAYGTVGLSLGYPNTTTSFSAQFTTISKLVIIAMMLRGRHRGLPYTLDRAVLLPSDKLEAKDRSQDLRMQRNRTTRSFSTYHTTGHNGHNVGGRIYSLRGNDTGAGNGEEGFQHGGMNQGFEHDLHPNNRGQ
ncbi:cation transport protein-domain-containing protein [Lipomyces oligophaga]|uniref:cation transport protein-domain-containing protein n=1 Tax=Lipomyces oligophaga TaxID=45792 RepID=UPI0034CE3328